MWPAGSKVPYYLSTSKTPECVTYKYHLCKYFQNGSSYETGFTYVIQIHKLSTLVARRYDDKETSMAHFIK